VTQKPIQNHRHGEVVEELPGSEKSVACVKRDITELGRPNWFLEVGVGEADQKTGAPKTNWESDQLIVLSERESRSQGEGADVDKQSAKETLIGVQSRTISANLTADNSNESDARLHAEAIIHEEPGAEKLHAGICAGAIG
jgi:hypothetical protein